MAKPVISVRRGGVSVSIWENTNDEGKVSYSSKFEKRFYDKASGQWKESAYLFENELLEASELLRLAWHKIGQRKAQAPPAATQAPPAAPSGEPIPF